MIDRIPADRAACSSVQEHVVEVINESPCGDIFLRKLSEPAEYVECKQLVWGKGDITRTLIRQQSRFPRTAPNLVALEQQRPGHAYPTWRDAASRAGRPPIFRQRRLNRRYEPVWVKAMAETSSTTPQRRPSQQ